MQRDWLTWFTRQKSNLTQQDKHPRSIYIFIEGLFIAQSTAQGHLRAVHKFKSHTLNTIPNMHIIYKSKADEYNPKVSPFGIALVCLFVSLLNV